MRLPRIMSLDLRPELVILAEQIVREDAEDRARQDAKWARIWNWPAFPARTAEFIETGIWPSHSRKLTVTIRGNAQPMMEALGRMSASLAGAMAFSFPSQVKAAKEYAEQEYRLRCESKARW